MAGKFKPKSIDGQCHFYIALFVKKLDYTRRREANPANSFLAKKRLQIA